MSKMRVAQVSRPDGPFEIVERPIPDPAAGEVRIKVEACGVCHSDMHTKTAAFPGIELPRGPGHEVIGRIDACAADVRGWKVGDRVGVGWHGGQCGQCENCRRGSWLWVVALLLMAPAATALADDALCVAALFQLEVLAGDWKVYKAGPAGERVYLSDRDRPAEVERLAGERDANCSVDPEALDAQMRRAHELFQAMSPDCLEAREKLRDLQRPTARSAPSDIEKQQAWVTAHCPDVSRTGVWLADWRYPRQKH